MNIRWMLMGLVVLVAAANADPKDPEPTGKAKPVKKDVVPVKNAKGEFELRLNFKDAPLSSVLEYLSKAGGFIILGEPKVSGNVTVYSHQPLNRNEAVNLLNTILAEKGYAAVRNDRVLRIVKQSEAKAYDLPVEKGNNPDEMLKTEEMITQIIPVRHATASKLLINIKPLLAEHATVSSNESSNAIVITDTRANIKRMAKIIYALDSSISDISTVKVFPLKYGDAEAIAKIVVDTFKVPTSGSSRSSSRGGFPFFGHGRSSSSSSSSQSAAQKAAAHVTATSDTRSNSVVVCAPAEALKDIEELIKELDVTTEENTVIQVYALKFADAKQMADMITELFSAATNKNSGSKATVQMGFPFMRHRPSNNKQDSKTSRQLAEAEVTAVADTRTNSVIVTASTERQQEIKAMLDKLDAGPSRSPRVFVHKVNYADLDKLKELLEGMFDDLENVGPKTNSVGGAQGFNTMNTGRAKNTNSRNTSQKR